MSDLSWATIPAEILHNIADKSLEIEDYYCPTMWRDMMNSTMCVNHHWAEAMRSSDYYTLATFQFGPNSIDDVHRYLTTPNRRGRTIYRLVLVFLDSKDYYSFYDSYDELFSEFTFKSISICIGTGPEDDLASHIRIPPSMKTFGLDITGAFSEVPLDWSSFTPFLRKYLRKLQLKRTRNINLPHQCFFANLQSLTIESNFTSDDYITIISLHSDIEHLLLWYNTRGEIDDFDFDEERKPLALRLGPLHKLKTLKTNYHLDYSNLELDSLVHLDLIGTTFAINDWKINPQSLQSLNLQECRLNGKLSPPGDGEDDDFINLDHLSKFKNLRRLHLSVHPFVIGNQTCRNSGYLARSFDEGCFDDCWPLLQHFKLSVVGVHRGAFDRFVSRHPFLEFSIFETKKLSHYSAW